jgi:hypothetical protein
MGERVSEWFAEIGEESHANMPIWALMGFTERWRTFGAALIRGVSSLLLF